MRLWRESRVPTVVCVSEAKTTTAVLGLGRMGAAIATALQDSGHPVQAWNRTSRTGPPGVQMLPEPGEAVAGATHVLLCLYDFDACREVLVDCEPALEPGCLVVNTSTIGPSEALDLERLVRGAGARYLHAPVMGSVPAVREGRLVVLAGGSRRDVDDARQVLDAVAREIRYVGDPGRAAALKLVANSSLASALVAIRDAIAASRAMGLDLSETLDVLATGQLGRLTEAKRDRTRGQPRFRVRRLRDRRPAQGREAAERGNRDHKPCRSRDRAAGRGGAGGRRRRRRRLVPGGRMIARRATT